MHQVLWTQSSVNLWDFRGRVTVHQSKPDCITAVTQGFFLLAQQALISGTQRNVPSPAQSTDPAMNTAQNEWMAAMQTWRGFVQWFSSPTSHTQELFVLLLIYTRPQ